MFMVQCGFDLGGVELLYLADDRLRISIRSKRFARFDVVRELGISR